MYYKLDNIRRTNVVTPFSDAATAAATATKQNGYVNIIFRRAKCGFELSEHCIIMHV